MQAKREWGAGRIAFIARREAIRAELAAGRSLTAIHAMHRDGLGIGYVQFTRYVQHYLRAPNDARPKPEAVPRKPSIEAVPTPKSFQFDPMAVDRKKLI